MFVLAFSLCEDLKIISRRNRELNRIKELVVNYTVNEALNEDCGMSNYAEKAIKIMLNGLNFSTFGQVRSLRIVH